jgi:hypothetical protein
MDNTFNHLQKILNINQKFEDGLLKEIGIYLNKN